MRIFILFSLVGLSVLAGGCASDDEDSKTLGCGLTVAGEQSETTFIVPVTGGGTQVCDAKVTARNGAFEEVLSLSSQQPASCNVFPMPEKVGTYEVTVEAAGYRTVIKQGVEVTSSYGCAGPRRYEVVLKPEEQAK